MSYFCFNGGLKKDIFSVPETRAKLGAGKAETLIHIADRSYEPSVSANNDQV